MFTNRVVACVVSGALASVILPHSPLAAPLEATTLSAELQPPSQTAVVVHPHSRPARREPLPLEKTVPARRDPLTAVTSSSQAKRKKKLVKKLGTFTVRAYTHYADPPNKTAAGTIPQVGRTVAVDPRVIPLGSRIHVEGVGELIAEDTGAKIKGKTLDLFLPSVKQCIQFGRREREVHLILDTKEPSAVEFD